MRASWRRQRRQSRSVNTNMKTLVLCLLVASAFAAPSGKPRFYRGRNMIVGGTDVKPGELPYQVSFQDVSMGYAFHFCGGSVYNEDTVITAGHCVEKHDFNNPVDLQIDAGDNSLSKDDGTEEIFAVTKIIRHEDFDGETLTNDVALLKFSTSLTFTDYVKPIALPKQMQDSTGDAVVSGWGTLSSFGEKPDILQKVTVPIVSDENCRTAYGKNKIFDSMICAGIGGKDSCQGDSGGPMVCTFGDETYLCGIVSWGYGCARPKYPGVYTEVSYFVDWIKANA